MSRLGMLGLRPSPDRCGSRLRLFASTLNTFCNPGSRLSGDRSRSYNLLRLSRPLSFRLDGLSFTFLSLALLFWFLDFLGLVLDAGKVAEDYCAILRQFCLSAQLHFEELLDDFVEFRPAGNPQGIQLRQRESLPQRTPFLNVVSEFRDHPRIGHFDFDEYDHFSGKRRDVEISVLRRVGFPSLQHLEDFLRLRNQIRHRIYFARSKLHVSHRRCCLAGLQPSERVERYRVLQAWPQPGGIKIRAHFCHFVEAVVIRLTLLQIRMDQG